MKDNDWIELVRLIPEDQQNKLVMTTMTGIDLNVEIILRMEDNYIVFRGRVSGITDEGRVFFLPYRQIDYMQLNRQVKEAEIHRMFGEEPAAEAAKPTSSVFAAPSGVFNAVATTDSQHGVPASPASPSAPAHVAGRPSLPGIAARLSAAPGTGRGSKPAAAPTADGPTPPRNSILERLRAQRNSVVTKPLGR